MNMENRLRDRLSGASEVLPGRPLEWGKIHARARRARVLYLATVALGTIATLAAGGFGAWAMLEARGGGSIPLPPASTESPSPEPDPSRSDGSGPAGQTSFEGPFRSVDTFIQAAAEGDAQSVWDEMTPFSKTAYDNDFDRFRASALSEIQEGWGSWASADDVGKQWQIIGASGEDTIGVVTLLGSRTAEGRRQPYASAAIPIRVSSEGKAQIELFPTRGIFEYEVPRDLSLEEPPALDALTARRPSFDVLVPSDASRVYMVVAPVPDEPAVSENGEAEIEKAGEDQVRAVWAPPGQLFGGEWFLTVVSVYRDGAMEADSVRFTIG